MYRSNKMIQHTITTSPHLEKMWENLNYPKFLGFSPITQLIIMELTSNPRTIFLRLLFNISRLNHPKNFNGFGDIALFLCGTFLIATICVFVEPFLAGQFISLCNLTYRDNLFFCGTFFQGSIYFFVQRYFSRRFVFLWDVS